MHTFRILLRLWRLNLQSAMAYRTSFLIQTSFMILNDGMMLLIWYFVFRQFGDIRGMDFGNYLTLYSVTLFSFCTVQILFAGYGNIATLAMNGGLDAHLLLPGSPLLRILAGRMMVSALGDLVMGFAVLALVPGLTWLLAAKILLTSVLGGFVMLGFYVATHSLVFWIGWNGGLHRAVFEAVLAPNLYPPGIFEKTWLKAVLVSVVPAWFVAQAPYLLSVGEWSWPEFGLLVAMAAFWLGLGAFVFRRGLARYESGGGMTVNG